MANVAGSSKVLAGQSSQELQGLAKQLSEPAYRGRQLANWIYKKGAVEFGQMTDLPSNFRRSLEDTFVVTGLATVSHQTSKDEVDKLLVHSGDDQVFECVLLPYRDRVSCCLSSQVGCPMGCTFCATGLGGFDRNLSVGDIVGQYLLLQSLTSRRIGHVVFMGMGEPLLNLDTVVAAMRVLHEEVGLSYRHITVSTVGLVPQIRALAELELPIHLALSLHSPFDAIRNELMPVNHKWPVAEVVQAMKDYARKTGRKVTFEYLVIEGVNDTAEQAKALSQLVRGVSCVVNLIPFNWVDTGHGFARPNQAKVAEFRKVLESSGVNVTQRVERGHDIAAACGQLAGQHAGRFAKRDRLVALPRAIPIDQ